jgi:acyl-CoA thioester hydrolase
MSADRPQPEARSAYPALRQISSRWADNDMYGHINNTVYYSWFDSAVNGLLIEHGALDVHAGTTIGLVVQTQCNYFAPLSFPEVVVVGVRVGHIGRTSVRYDLAVFPADPALPCAARGHFVHVYVDRISRQPTPLTSKFLSVLESLK